MRWSKVWVLPALPRRLNSVDEYPSEAMSRAPSRGSPSTSSEVSNFRAVPLPFFFIGKQYFNTIFTLAAGHYQRFCALAVPAIALGPARLSRWLSSWRPSRTRCDGWARTPTCPRPRPTALCCCCWRCCGRLNPGAERSMLGMEQASFIHRSLQTNTKIPRVALTDFWGKRC